MQDTPAVVYDLPRLQRTAVLLKALCEPFGICCFAVKANRYPRVLAELAAAGFGADVASAKELDLAGEAGLWPTVATAPALTDVVIRRVAAAGGTVFFDNLEQARFASREGIDLQDHGLRIAVPGAYASFGFVDHEVAAFRQELRIVPRRFHFHCGEVETCPRLVQLLRFVKTYVTDFGVTKVDLGGGYGLLSNDLAAMREAFAILGLFAREHAVQMIFEFGKVAVARCGTLVATVAARKIREGRQVAVLNTSSFNLGSLERRRFWKSSAHREGVFPTRIIGSSCFEGDVFVAEAFIPVLDVGDKVAFSQFGAYTMSVAGSIHALDLPREVVFEG